ncbi:hypothetical protein J2751_002255 [Halorubrum alkaliphilum]|uniref:Uncharacterized protein n=1 Tax=Halorubrum alkaliphilum TaxID=261290 RepID=A0A8T4GG84_9EURY|nr:hypothetical protein [Halorubrum alkaliphilum]MBP1923216.1 hypothetical protein [Halorubrum alkaliphilum]
MTDDSTEHVPDAVTSLIRESRLVFGAVLVDGTTRIVERLDRGEFDADEAEMALATAFTSANADLVPFVTDEDRPDGGSTDATEGPDRESDRITTVADALIAIADAHTYYLLCNTEPGAWKRIRNAADGGFDSDAGTDGSAADRYRVADDLVDEATERIGDLPDSVTGTEIEVIDWSG